MSAQILNFQVDDDYNKTIAERMTHIRKLQGLTQIEMAETLGITQGSYGHYETGFRRLPLEILPSIAEALNTSVEDLLGVDVKKPKRGPKSQLERRFEKIKALPKSKQKEIINVVDALLKQAS